MDAQRDFERVYAACEPAVRAFVLRRIGPDGVDDVVSEAFLAGWDVTAVYSSRRYCGWSILRVHASQSCCDDWPSETCL
jgi:hypothetical protein